MAPNSNRREGDDDPNGEIWDRLDSISWGELRQAHGTAERVPEAIRALAVAEPREIEDLYWRLDNVVTLQGSVYESAFYLIPYVLAIVDSDRPPENRAAAYDLLVEIARGTSADPDCTVLDDDGQARPLLDASIKRIARGRRRYEADLQQGDPLVRRKALDLLTSMRLIDDPARLLAVLRGLDVTGDSEFKERVEEEAADL